MRITRLHYHVVVLICASFLQPAMPIHAQGVPPIKPSQALPPLRLTPSPATCPSGYIVNGKFVSKADFQAGTASIKKPTSPLSGPSLPTPSIPGVKLALPVATPPKITTLTWNFTDNILEILGTDFTESYSPRAGEPTRATTPRLFINGAIDVRRQPVGGFFIRTPSVQQSGCYQFVVQRRVPKQQGSVFTEELGPQSLPYQEFFFVPKRVVLDSVQPLPADVDHPLTYQIRGADIGRLDSQTQIVAAAQPNQRLPDGSPGQIMTLGQVQIKDQNTIVVSNELVQGDTVHAIKFADPHYGMLQSNNVSASMPRRLIIDQIALTDTGYLLRGPNFGSDLTQLRALENTNQLPQQNLSLQVITGLNSNTFEIRVNSSVTGSVVHQVFTLTPGIGASRRVSFTHPVPPSPAISGLELTNYGFDVVGSNLGHDPNTAVLLLQTGPTTGLVISAGQVQFNASFFRQVTDSRIAVNYASGCQILPLLRNVQTQVQVSAIIRGIVGNSQQFPFTFPQTWTQYTPVIKSVTKTANGLEIAGTSLGQAQEVCQINVLAAGQNGAS